MAISVDLEHGLLAYVESKIQTFEDLMELALGYSAGANFAFCFVVLLCGMRAFSCIEMHD